MKMKKILISVMVLTLLITGMVGNGAFIKADTLDSELVFAEEDYNLVVKPGETTQIRLPVRTKSLYITDVIASIEADDANSPFTFTRPKLVTENNTQVSVLMYDTTIYVVFDVKTKETAGIKSYPVSLKIKGNTFPETEINETLTFDLKILEEKVPTQLIVNKVLFENLYPGANTKLSFSVKNEGQITARSIYMNIDFGDSGLIKDYSAPEIKINDLGPGMEQQISLPVKVLSTASTGQKTLTANFNFKNMDGDKFSGAYSFNIALSENKEAPKVDIEDISYSALKPGEKFILTAVLRNFGLNKAENVAVSIDESGESNSFIKNYYTDKIEVSNILPDKTKKVEIPLVVSGMATGGPNALKLNITYSDDTGITFTKTKTLYLDVADDNTSTNIIIGNVKQSPLKPVAGERLEISFDMQNKGSADLADLKIKIENLTGNTFVPVEPEPYYYVGVLEAGSSKRITIPLTVSENIPEGLNTLSLAYSYTGGSGGKVDIPVLDVQNDLGSNSKPKLIVSKYTADIEELRAGSVFNFTFELRNTHSSVSAKNITVKVSSSTEGQSGQTEVFAPTQGSNSFFINKIDPGETIENTLELKIKSDAATNSYPIYVIMEYEYDGIEPNPTTGEIGETKTEELSLQVVENARPVVDYVNVYSYDGMVTIGNPALLSFEFYNMGKSTLNNVIATVEGDFTNSTGNMYFLGNVPAGDRSYAEFEVIPNIEGLAKGTVRITYEDSNGDEVVYTKEFESQVNPAQVFDPGMTPGGDVDVFNPILPEPKKAILPVWAFILAEIAIFAIFLPVTRKIIISIYKKRLRNKEEENF